VKYECCHNTRPEFLIVPLSFNSLILSFISPYFLRFHLYALCNFYYQISAIKSKRQNKPKVSNQIEEGKYNPKGKMIEEERGGGTTIKSLSTDQMILQLKPKDREKRGPYL